MKTVILGAIRCSLMFLVSAVAAALTNLNALAQCPTNVPHITGTWTVLPYQMPINPISANLLPNGKVLIVAGSENDASNNSEGAESYRGAVWDPSGTNESSISVQNLTYDVFCSGTAALFDGRSLIVGGTSDYSFTGENRASIFNPATSQYVQSQNMVDGRWYATATATCRWSHYGNVRPHAKRRYKSNDRNLRSPTSWNGLESTYQRPVHATALPKNCAVTRWESVLYRTRRRYFECKCLDLQPGHGRVDAISYNQSRPQLRLISFTSSSAAQLRSPRDKFRGGSKSGDLFYRHYRPLRCNPELHRRPEYVHRSYPDECRYPAQRQGPG